MTWESSLPQVTPAHFLERARLYRFAAAIADSRREIALFNNLAMTFEQLAWHFLPSMNDTATAPNRFVNSVVVP
jgi:hypothetical protein